MGASIFHGVRHEIPHVIYHGACHELICWTFVRQTMRSIYGPRGTYGMYREMLNGGFPAMESHMKYPM